MINDMGYGKPSNIREELNLLLIQNSELILIILQFFEPIYESFTFIETYVILFLLFPHVNVILIGLNQRKTLS